MSLTTHFCVNHLGIGSIRLLYHCQQLPCSTGCITNQSTPLPPLPPAPPLRCSGNLLCWMLILAVYQPWRQVSDVRPLKPNTDPMTKTQVRVDLGGKGEGRGGERRGGLDLRGGEGGGAGHGEGRGVGGEGAGKEAGKGEEAGEGKGNLGRAS